MQRVATDNQQVASTAALKRYNKYNSPHHREAAKTHTPTRSNRAPRMMTTRGIDNTNLPHRVPINPLASHTNKTTTHQTHTNLETHHPHNMKTVRDKKIPTPVPVLTELPEHHAQPLTTLES
ncbi:unnamed protein product [Ectocarpus sp. 6 AP-2014]